MVVQYVHAHTHTCINTCIYTLYTLYTHFIIPVTVACIAMSFNVELIGFKMFKLLMYKLTVVISLTEAHTHTHTLIPHFPDATVH